MKLRKVLKSRNVKGRRARWRRCSQPLIAAILIQSALALTLPACAKQEDPSKALLTMVAPAAPDSRYAHAAVERQKIGKGGGAAWIFTPAVPRPPTAPVVLFLHGWQGTDPGGYGAWIDHLARLGNIVIYPIFEEGMRDPSEKIMHNAIEGTKDALRHLRAQGPVKPETDRFAIVGHSFGGGLAAQIAARAADEGLPIPKAVMPVQPGWREGVTSDTYPVENLDRVPGSILLLVVEGDVDQFQDARQGWNIISLTRKIPAKRKSYVQLRSKQEGKNQLIADHYAPLAPHEAYRLEKTSRRAKRISKLLRMLTSLREGEVDALDRDGFWKLFDTLRAAAFRGGCEIECVLNRAAKGSTVEWYIGRP